MKDKTIIANQKQLYEELFMKTKNVQPDDKSSVQCVSSWGALRVQLHANDGTSSQESPVDPTNQTAEQPAERCKRIREGSKDEDSNDNNPKRQKTPTSRSPSHPGSEDKIELSLSEIQAIGNLLSKISGK